MVRNCDLWTMLTLNKKDLQTMSSRGGKSVQTSDDLVRVIFDKVGINCSDVLDRSSHIFGLTSQSISLQDTQQQTCFQQHTTNKCMSDIQEE